MNILEKTGNKDVWMEFYEYKSAQSAVSDKDAKRILKWIEDESFTELSKKLTKKDFCFEPPIKKEVNKFGSQKKRIVYSYKEDGSMMLKLIAFLLYKYDDVQANNLYSFRRNTGAKRAIKRITSTRDIDSMFCYKVDIKNYFNSINIEKLLPILEKLLEDEKELFEFLKRLLTADKAYFNDKLVEEKRGAMAGTPISPFLANIYLMELDRYFESKSVLYARYSDDIIVFAKSKDELESYADYIKSFFANADLTVNTEKEYIFKPNEPWDFLGVKYNGGTVDISRATKDKLKGKIRRKAKSICRWKKRKGTSDEKAMQVFARVINRKLFDNPRADEITWARWFFSLINTSESLKEIDAYIQQNMRYVACEKYSKSNYRISYEQLKSCGYKSLVNAYYQHKELSDGIREDALLEKKE